MAGAQRCQENWLVVLAGRQLEVAQQQQSSALHSLLHLMLLLMLLLPLLLLPPRLPLPPPLPLPLLLLPLVMVAQALQLLPSDLQVVKQAHELL